jgi:hypothetical protein
MHTWPLRSRTKPEDASSRLSIVSSGRKFFGWCLRRGISAEQQKGRESKVAGYHFLQGLR